MTTSAHIPTCGALAAAALLLAGCGEPPQGPEAPPLDLTGDTVVITAIGDTAGVAPAGASLRGVGQRRWLHDRAVLDSTALREGLVVATGPGTAGVEATLPDGEPKDVVVEVRPDRPVVLDLRVESPVSPGEVAIARGYRMAELGDGLLVNGGSPEVVAADSANLWFRVPGSTDSDECNGAGIGVISADGARVFGELSYRVRRPGELALEVGEGRLLERGTRCLQLAPRDSARYALAYIDVDAIENARDGPEGFDRQIEPPPDLFSVTLADGVLPEGARAGAGPAGVRLDGVRGGRAVGASDVRRVEAAGTTDCGDRDFRDPCEGYRSRSTPWEVGDTFLTDLPDGRSGRARIVQLHEGYLAVALFEEDSASFGPSRRDAFREAARTALDVAVPRLRESLTSTYPVTSDGSGQLLVLLSRFTADSIQTGGESGLVFFDTDDEGRFPWIVLNLSASWDGSSAFLGTIAHELTHAWGRQYLWEEPSSGGERDWGLSPLWAEEGVADYFAHETLRSVAAIGPLSNFGDWHDFSAPGPVQRYSSEPRYAAGTLSLGYEHASSFLRDLVARRASVAGEGWPEASAAVTRGALEGWYGYDEYGAKRTGLTRRMRDALGEGWEPPRAVLRWTVSQALDDRTGSSVYQNRAFDSVSADVDCTCGWRPHTTLEAGEGEGLTLGRRYGSSGYFFLDDRGLGGSYRLGWDDTDEPVRWMVARYR